MTAGLLLIGIGWVGGWLLLWRPPVLRGGSRAEGERSPGGAPVAVVVPARDEEDRLPLLLADLAGQTVRPAEVVVVDDGSEDGTALAAAEHEGVVVVAAPERPAGWTGKTWAVATGVAATSSPIVVTVDADVRLAPGALAGLLAEHERGGGLVSVQPRHDTVRPVEALSLLFNVVAAMGLGIGTPRRRFAGWGAAGPLLVTSRDDLAVAGGLAGVRREVAEDLALAAAYRRADRPVTCLLGGDQVRFRMYRGVRELVVGWTKNIATGARWSPPVLGAAVALWVAALAAAAVEVVRALAGGGLPMVVAAVVHLAVAVQVGLLGRRVGRFGAAAVVWPVLVAVFVAVFAWSGFATFVLRRVRWSGRTIRLGGDAAG